MQRRAGDAAAATDETGVTCLFVEANSLAAGFEHMRRVARVPVISLRRIYVIATRKSLLKATNLIWSRPEVATLNILALFLKVNVRLVQHSMYLGIVLVYR